MAILLVAGAAAGGWWLLRSPETPRVEAPTEAPKSSAPTPEQPPSRLEAAPTPTRSPEMPQAMIRYPDGTYMPALNGVKNPAPLHWPADRPFTPIIGKRLCGGTWWYEHADGTMTTCEMQWRSDLGRTDAASHVAVPKPALPVEPPDPPTESSPKK